VAIWAAIAFWDGRGALAFDSPPMCDPKEDPAVCGLKIERNNIADEAAVYRGQLQQNKLRAETVEQWWKEYLVLTDHQRKALRSYWAAYAHAVPYLAGLDRHLRSACAWRAAQTQPVAELCRWWKQTPMKSGG
jgi:hypothetical protein